MKKTFLTLALSFASWNTAALSLYETNRILTLDLVRKALKDVQIESIRNVQRIPGRFFLDSMIYRSSAVIVCGVRPSNLTTAVDKVATVIPANYAYDIFHDEIMQRVSTIEDPLCKVPGSFSG